MKGLRQLTGLSRADFATKYGFNHNRLLNMEQGFRATLQLDEIGTYLEIIYSLGKDPRDFFPVLNQPNFMAPALTNG